jgi:hypothetical protein
MSKSNHLLIGLSILFLFIISACKKDNPCDTPRQGENYMLSDSAKAYVNNYNNAQRVIFKTLSGNEVAFEVIRTDTTASYEVSLPCESDLSQKQSVRGNSELIRFALINSLIWDEPIYIYLFKFPELENREAQENLWLSLGPQFSNAFKEENGLFYKTFNVNNPDLNFLDSLLVGGKTFYNVYEWNGAGTTPGLEVKYNMSEGIVYIKDPATGEEYVYERKEE